MPGNGGHSAQDNSGHSADSLIDLQNRGDAQDGVSPGLPGTGKTQVISQNLNQRPVILHLHTVVPAIDLEMDLPISLFGLHRLGLENGRFQRGNSGGGGHTCPASFQE